MEINLGLGGLAAVALSALLAWLKVDHNLQIGWWLVFLPVWIGLAIILLFFVGLFSVAAILAIIKKI